jgi:hypothetical protein
MKKSNKVLCTVIVTILMAIIITAIAFRLLAPVSYSEQFSYFSSDSIKGNGKMVAQQIYSSKFNTIQGQGKFDITINSGESNNIILHTDENIIAHISITTNDKTLQIRTLDPIDVRPKITITSNNIDTMNFSGKVTVLANQLHAKKLSVNASGKSNLYLKGYADVVYFNISGKSTIDATNLIANNVVINSTGNSVISVNAIQTLTINSFGKSNVTYKGNPTITKNIAGEANIEKL